jgi:hypothetical protein
MTTAARFSNEILKKVKQSLYKPWRHLGEEEI